MLFSIPLGFLRLLSIPIVSLLVVEQELPFISRFLVIFGH